MRKENKSFIYSFSKRLGALSCANDLLHLAHNDHELQKRTLIERIEQLEFKLRTLSREADQLRERNVQVTKKKKMFLFCFSFSLCSLFSKLVEKWFGGAEPRTQRSDQPTKRMCSKQKQRDWRPNSASPRAQSSFERGVFII